MWFYNWLVDYRWPDETPITRETPLSPDEIDESLAAAIRVFGCNLLCSAEIETAGEFVDLIERQTQHRGNRKKIAS